MTGDPTPKTPGEVLRSPSYKMVESNILSGYLVELVVMHCGTDTFWRTTYSHSQIDMPAHWTQVRRIVVTQVQWRSV